MPRPGKRGYLLTGDKTFLEPYLAVRDNLSAHLQALHHQALMDAARKHLNAITPLLDANLAEMAQVIEVRHSHSLGRP